MALTLSLDNQALQAGDNRFHRGGHCLLDDFLGLGAFGLWHKAAIKSAVKPGRHPVAYLNGPPYPQGVGFQPVQIGLRFL